MADATYYGTTDAGTDLYYGPGGSFVDENGVTLAISSGTNINLASGDSLVYGGVTAPPPLPSTALVTADGGNASNALSGVADIFGSVGTAFSKVFGSMNPAKPTQLPGQVGSYVYNPGTGQYMPAVQGTSAQSQIGTVFMFAAVALVVILAMKH